MKAFQNTVIGGMIVAMIAYLVLLYLIFAFIFKGLFGIFNNLAAASAARDAEDGITAPAGTILIPQVPYNDPSGVQPKYPYVQL
jgi:hypothetical protein